MNLDIDENYTCLTRISRELLANFIVEINGSYFPVRNEVFDLSLG